MGGVRNGLAGVACPSRGAVGAAQSAVQAATRRAWPDGRHAVQGDGQSDIHWRTGRDDDAGIGFWFGIATPHGVPSARNELRMAIWSTGELFNQGTDAPWTPTRGKEPKTQDSIQRPGNSETDTDVPEPGGAPAANRGTHETRIEVPRAATQHPATAIPSARPRSPVWRRPRVIVVPAVLYPLPYVPVHIVQSISVRRK